MYLGDDESGSCCLYFKPWIIKNQSEMKDPSQYEYASQDNPHQGNIDQMSKHQR
jgi:hypothetical protein